MLSAAYKNSSSSSNRNVSSTGNNWLNQTNFTERSGGYFYQFWGRYLRKAWHYIVVPPLVATAKRLEHEEAMKNKRNNNANDGSENVNHHEDEEEFHIDYKQATKDFFRRLLAEAVGTTILTTILGADLLEARLGIITAEAASFNNGLAVLFLIHSLGGISGAHFNPVVTFAFTIRRIFPLIWLPFYMLSQFVGSIIGGLLIRALFGGQFASLGTNSVNTLTSTVANGFKWEIFLTFFLVFVILQTATKSDIIGSQAAIAVGAVLAVVSLIGGTKSTASMNPWRTLGPSIINNSPDNRHSLWIYIVGPLLGSLLSYVAVSMVQGFRRKKDEISAAHGGELNNEADDIDRNGFKNFVP